MRNSLRSLGVCFIVGLALVGIGTPAYASGPSVLQAVPSVFVGAVGDCGTLYPAGSRIVTAQWSDGLGLPDNGGLNTSASDLSTNPNKNDEHDGLLLSKNGPTPDCSAAGATIKGVKGMVVTSPFVLGFDFRNGNHCGAGAPRFNITTDHGSFFSFLGGCSNSTLTPAPQDPTAWTRARIDVFNPAQAFPVLVPGMTITSLEIVFDEGTDSGNGLAIIDNIFINGRYISDDDHGNKRHGDNDHGDNDHRDNDHRDHRDDDHRDDDQHDGDHHGR
jgi:hypothetical protein